MDIKINSDEEGNLYTDVDKMEETPIEDYPMFIAELEIIKLRLLNYYNSKSKNGENIKVKYV